MNMGAKSRSSGVLDMLHSSHEWDELGLIVYHTRGIFIGRSTMTSDYLPTFTRLYVRPHHVPPQVSVFRTETDRCTLSLDVYLAILISRLTLQVHMYHLLVIDSTG